jgi:hypothetical protein
MSAGRGGWPAVKIGVGVISSGDPAALGATLDALSPTSRFGGPISVVEHSEDDRFHLPIPGVNEIQISRLPSYADPAPFLMTELRRSCHVVLILRAGLVPTADLLAEAQGLFTREQPPAACVFVGERRFRRSVAGIGKHGVGDPNRLGLRGLKYFAPAMLWALSDQADARHFERFARRSDWATYRLYADRLTAMGLKVLERPTEWLMSADGHDEALNFESGRRVSAELRRFGIAHPAYGAFTDGQRWRALAHQAAGITRGSRLADRLSFTWGVMAEVRANARLRRKLHQDVAELA